MRERRTAGDGLVLDGLALGLVGGLGAVDTLGVGSGGTVSGSVGVGGHGL